jgi:hypothetical protein
MGAEGDDPSLLRHVGKGGALVLDSPLSLRMRTAWVSLAGVVPFAAARVLAGHDSFTLMPAAWSSEFDTSGIRAMRLSIALRARRLGSM